MLKIYALQTLDYQSPDKIPLLATFLQQSISVSKEERRAASNKPLLCKSNRAGTQRLGVVDVLEGVLDGNEGVVDGLEGELVVVPAG